MEPTTIAGYVIEKKLGEGGMGVVYLARHPRLNRSAVVKMLRRELADNPEMAKRFENEANAAASIGHPGIVDVYDIGRNEDGVLYIVMELLRGESLRNRLDRERTLGPVKAVSILTHCADALAVAHERGIVHRDLKPDNIFLVPDTLVAGGERAKLLDFGIAKLAGDAGAMTQTGAMMGTPLYMSPEQCQGAGLVDHRTDLYALGCILFEMLAGRPPFGGSGVGDFIVAHMTKPPPSLRSVAPLVTPELERVVDKLLAKSPDDRFASARALIAALDGGVPRDETPATSVGLAATMVSTSPTLPSRDAASVPPSTTTLGTSAGERMPASAQSSPPTGRSRARWALPIGGGVLLLTGAAVAVVATRQGNEEVHADAGIVAAKPALPIDAAPTASIDAAATAPPVDRLAASRKAGWLAGIEAFERIRGNSYTWRGAMSALEANTVLSIQLAQKQAGKDQAFGCNVEWGPDGNPAALADCVATFSDVCKPSTQIRQTKRVALTCGQATGGFECATAPVVIPLCVKSRIPDDDDGIPMHCVANCDRYDWRDSKTVFAVRRPLVPADRPGAQ